MHKPNPDKLEAMQLYGAEDFDELNAVLRVLDEDERSRRQP